MSYQHNYEAIDKSGEEAPQQTTTATWKRILAVGTLSAVTFFGVSYFSPSFSVSQKQLLLSEMNSSQDTQYSSLSMSEKQDLYNSFKDTYKKSVSLILFFLFYVMFVLISHFHLLNICSILIMKLIRLDSTISLSSWRRLMSEMLLRRRLVEVVYME